MYTARRWLFELCKALLPCGVCAVIVLLVSVALGFVPQGEDILEAFVERTCSVVEPIHWLTLVGFFSAVTLYATAAWYSARLALYFRPGAAAQEATFEVLIKAVPRAIGVGAYLGIAIDFLHLRVRYDDVEPPPLDSRTLSAAGLLALALVACGGLFLWVVYLRRIWLERRHQGAVDRRWVRLRDAQKGTLLAAGVALLLAVAALVAFSSMPIPIGGAVGAEAVVLLAAAAWLPIGTLISYAGRRIHIPLVPVLLVLALPLSTCNDNHAVRRAGALPVLPTLEQELARWASFIRQREPDTARHPLVLVAAEGGGSLAGYWTATALAQVQDAALQGTAPVDFANHVFAMSSVSGGSLGCTVFAALAAEPSVPRDGFSVRARCFMARDFLSPLLGMMLFPEVLQKVWWPGVEAFDRSRAIEIGWEDEWQQVVPHSERFAQPFTDLYTADCRLLGGPRCDAWVPLLVLNSTWVESGNRGLMAPFQADIFKDAKSVTEVMQSDVRLSTAVHNSARFPYINPIGTVQDAQGKTRGHLIDGGLFETSGATTVLEISAALEALLAADHVAQDHKPRYDDIGPVIVVLANSTPVETSSGADSTKIAPATVTPAEAPPPQTVNRLACGELPPGLPPAGALAASAHGCGQPLPPTKFLGWQSKNPSSSFLLGALGPAVALMHSREARATWAVDTVSRQPNLKVFQFGTCPRDAQGHPLPLPVSWELSAFARETMDRQLREACGTRGRDFFDNPTTLANLLAELRCDIHGPASAGSRKAMAGTRLSPEEILTQRNANRR